MNARLLSVFDNLRSETNAERFWQEANRALGNFGVTSILYNSVAFSAELDAKPVTHVSLIKSNHPDEYFETFGRETLLDGDWTADHCRQNTDVLLWHGITQWEAATAEQRKRASIERDMGLFVGISIPASRFNPNYIGGLGVSMGEIDYEDFDSYWKTNSRDILTICGVLDAGMRARHLEDVVALSNREKECLMWLAVGSRPDSIGERLRISRSSVDKYLTNARTKLKAGTLEQAVAKAVFYNLIQP